MALVQITEGSFPEQPVLYSSGKMAIMTHEGGRKTYLMKAALTSLNLYSDEGKNKIVFNAGLKDGNKFTAHTDRKSFEALQKGIDTSYDPEKPFIVEEITPEQAKRRKKINKITLSVFGSFIGLIILGSFLTPDTPQKTTTNSPNQVQEHKPSDRWLSYSEKSLIDDSRSVIIQVEADTTFENDFGKTIRPQLFIRCMENKTVLGINYDTFIGAERTPVTYRLDKTDAKTTDWIVTTNNLAVLAPSAIPITRKMMDSNRLVVRLTPYGANTVTTEFDLYGLQEAIKTVQEACGWK